MEESIVRGEHRSFTIYLALPENGTLTAEHDAVVMVKRSVADENADALIVKRLRAEPPTLVLEQANGVDPESGEGNYAIISGAFTAEDTNGMFTGVRQRADALTYPIEAGVIFPDGYYDRQLDATLTVENTLVHLPLS